MQFKPLHTRLRIALLATALVGATMSVSVAQAADAATASERAAVRVRVLQSDMMVAALSCDLRNHYNEAVRRFQAELVLHGRQLRAFFGRVYGKGGQRELDRFVTAMANGASSRSVAQGSAYCTTAERMMNAVLALPPNGLAEFSRTKVDLATIRVPDLVQTALRPRN
jgi:hypothetical protein